MDSSDLCHYGSWRCTAGDKRGDSSKKAPQNPAALLPRFRQGDGLHGPPCSPQSGPAHTHVEFCTHTADKRNRPCVRLGTVSVLGHTQRRAASAGVIDHHGQPGTEEVSFTETERGNEGAEAGSGRNYPVKNSGAALYP
ncbi:hypothetical protein SRHO_G00255840 [Serrasalmus rhombeus]